MVLGIDPDMHHCAWALLEPDSSIHDCGIVRVPDRLKGSRAIVEMARQFQLAFHGPLANWEGVELTAVIETQHYSDKGSKVKIKNLLNLALVSGIAIANGVRLGEVELADPTIWTKGWEKPVRHNRLRELTYGMTDAELASDYGFNPGDAIHVWDAIDLALWWQRSID